MRHTPKLAFAFAVAATLLAACEKTTSAPVSNPRQVDSPRLSLGSGIANPTLARTKLGAINFHSNLNGFNVLLQMHDDADVEVTNGAATAGGHSGWHYHPGPVFVLVRTGALTIYHANDPSCHG